MRRWPSPGTCSRGSPRARRLVDLKFLVVFVEKSMDVLVGWLSDPASTGGGPRALVDGSCVPAVRIGSRLFCYAFPSDGIVPEELGRRGRALAGSPAITALGIEDPELEAMVREGGREPAMCFEVVRGVRACVALGGARLALLFDRPGALAGPLAEAILGIARVQTQVLGDMLKVLDDAV
jgi:hypothetical protein